MHGYLIYILLMSRYCEDVGQNSHVLEQGRIKFNLDRL